MKLELKHLSPYLPYGLKGICTWEHLNKDFEVELYSASSNILNISSPFGGNDYVEINEFKPILRPLSDLTKEIKINGETFVPIDALGWNSYENIIKKGICDSVGYQYMIKLFEWHFDVFGLIEQNLAIDINTLNK